MRSSTVYRRTARGHLSRTAAAIGSAIAVLTVSAAAGPVAGLSAQVPGSSDLPPQHSVPSPEHCRDGDPVETGLQGEVPREDRHGGRSTGGYWCNVDLVGHEQDLGAGITSVSHEHCQYLGSTWPSEFLGDATPGVRVMDFSEPTDPTVTTVLDAPAFAGGTWESLKVSPERELLVGTGVGLIAGAGTIAVYDISGDCTRPWLLNTEAGQPSMPVPITTHEGNFSPDGRTYWVSGVVAGHVSAVDLTDPAHPVVVWSGLVGPFGHGLGFSPDGRTMYAADVAGISIYDVSAVQDRAPRQFVPAPIPKLSEMHWSDGELTQHSFHVTYDGRPHLWTVQEAGGGGARLIDIGDPRAPRHRTTVRLEINLPEHAERWFRSAGTTGPFGYDAHYCTVDRPDDPQALACGWQQSGIRVFDIRNPDAIREIAYFNPPAQTGKTAFDLPNSMHATLGSMVAPPAVGTLHVARSVLQGQAGTAVLPPDARVLGADLTADWCFSPPEWFGSDLRVTCSDFGAFQLRLDPSVYPPR